MGLGAFLDWLLPWRQSVLNGGGFVSSIASANSVGEMMADQAKTASAVYASIQAYTSAISTMDFGPCDATSDEFKPLKDHYLWPILHDEWNPEQTSQQGVSYSVDSLFSRGKSITQIIRKNNGRVMELNPLDPADVKRDRYDGRIGFKVNGEKDILPDREALYVPINYSKKLLDGKAPIIYAQTQIALANSLDIFSLTYFTQGAQPRFLLEHPGTLAQKQAEEIVNNFNKMLVGTGNGNSTGIVYGGVKANKISNDPEEAQFIETKRYSVNDIARFFNLPPSRIGGDRSSGTYANLQQDQAAFLAHSIRPVCRMFEQEFNRKLLTPEERKTVAIRFDIDDLIEELAAGTGAMPATSTDGADTADTQTETANADE